MIRKPALTVLLALSSTLILATPLHAADSSLTTLSERSGFLKTGRYDEVIALCDAFARRYPDAVRCIEFGTTPEGRPMKALVATRTGAMTPEAAREKGIPVLLVQGGIHAGEIDGKDAGFQALRQVLDGEAAPGALDRQVLLFVPVFNVDGHERFGAWNRPNQRGPQQMGWRTTAQNYNLNRDYVKADAPEMQAMLALINAWDPLAYVDLHVTDGAKFEHDVSIQVEPVHAGDTAMREAGRALRDGVVADLAREGSLPLVFYPSFVEGDNPQSGFVDSVPPPRFSHGYMQLRNRIAMLVETHSWKDYPTRVRITRNTIVSLLEHVGRDGSQWLETAHAADVRATNLAGKPVPLEYIASDKVRTIDFRGYEYTRTPSDISGALMTRYDDTKPQIWKLPLRDEIVPGRSVVAGRRKAAPAWHRVPHAGQTAAQGEARGVPRRQDGLRRRLGRRPPAADAGRRLETRGARCRSRRLVRSDLATEGAAGDGAARAAGTRCVGRVGRIQQQFRTQGIHGSLRRRRRGAGDAGEGPQAEGRIRAEAEGRSGLRQGSCRAAGLLCASPQFLGRTLQPVSGAAHRGGAEVR